MIRFIPSQYARGRILLRCGTVDVGAIFPAVNDRDSWRWRVWVTASGGASSGKAKGELAAKNAALDAFRSFLRAAKLMEAQHD